MTTNNNDAGQSGQTPSIEQLTNAVQVLHSFVSRRFDEVSAEINATSQMLGMTEEALARRFSEVLMVLNAVSFKGDGSTPHNVGVELDAVVKTAEEAANKILDCADDISKLTRQDINWSDDIARTKLLQQIDKHAGTILAACEFQDLTGQRIGRTLENIRRAEAELTDTLKRMGLKIDLESTAYLEAQTSTTGRAQSQDDIDALFS